MNLNADNHQTPDSDKATAEELERRLTELEKVSELAKRSRLALLDSLEDRHLAETQLRASEERFRSLYNSMNEGVALHRLQYDSEGRPVDYIIESVNPAYERILGLKAEDVEGKPASEVYGLSSAPYLDIYAAVANDRQPAHFEIKHEPAGKIFRISVSSPGKGLFATVFDDITESRQLSEQLENMQRLESIGRLAGGVAHDFNNMLSVILGNLEMVLEDTPENDRRHHDLEEIRKAAQRSADLTRQMLAFARRQTVTPRVINLNSTLESMLDMMQRLLGEDICLKWRPAADLWPVKIDPSQIDQIIANLCVNARDAIKGIGNLTVQTTNTEVTEHCCNKHSEIAPGEYVTLDVSDNGCGMAKNVLRHIFEPFFTTKKMGLGSGLGLSTVYGIVKQNRGFIHAYSELGHGTTFKIGFPRHTGHTGEERPAEISAGAIEYARSADETILLVEDETSILSMIQAMLEKLGYRVLAASAPQAALKTAREYKEKINLLLTDVIMPEMDGLELARRLKTELPDMRCLFMSGYTADVIISLGSNDSRTDFIQKPFSLPDLSHKVRAAVDV